MPEEKGRERGGTESTFSLEVGAQADRKRAARRRSGTTVWFGLGMSGLVGWTVAVPTLVGAAAGHWADTSYPSPYSWTLMLLVTGLIIGCSNAWHWVSSENQKIGENIDE